MEHPGIELKFYLFMFNFSLDFEKRMNENAKW